MFKRYIFFLMVVLAFAGITACSLMGESTNGDAANSYEEKIIANDLEFARHCKVNSKGQIVTCFEAEKSRGYWYLDSEGVKSREFPYDSSESGSVFALDAQDNLYVILQKFEKDAANGNKGKYSKQLKVYNAEGTLLRSNQLENTDIADENNLVVKDIAVDSKGYIFLLMQNNTIKILDSSAREVKTIKDRHVACMDVDSSGNLVLVGYSAEMGDKVWMDVRHPLSDKMVWKAELDKSDIPLFVRYSKDGKSIYSVHKKGVVKYEPQGNSKGQFVLDFKQYSMLSFETQIISAGIDSSNNLYFLTSSSGAGAKNQCSIYKYSFVKSNGNTENQKVLTLSTIKTSRYLETAISRFQKENPGVVVRVKEFDGQMDSMVDYEKYVKVLNADILTGKSPDIINVIGLPYQRYADKGILQDMKQLMTEDKSFQLDHYYENAFEAVKYKNVLYTVPINLSFQVFAANKGMLDKVSVKVDDRKWSWKDFLDYSVKVIKASNNGNTSGQYALPNITNDEIFTFLFAGSYKKFVDTDKKASHFVSGEFIDFLNFSKRFIDENLINPMIDPGKAVYGLENLDSTAFMPMYICNFRNYLTSKELFSSGAEVFMIPSDNGNTGRVFTTNMLYGISRNSKYKTEAWNFIKFLLSDEMQSPEELGNLGFPVNKIAFKQRVQAELKQKEKISMVGNLRLKSFTQEDAVAIEGIISSLNTHTDYDLQVIKIVSEEAKLFITGEKTAEEVSGIIQSRVETYLKE